MNWIKDNHSHLAEEKRPFYFTYFLRALLGCPVRDLLYWFQSDTILEFGFFPIEFLSKKGTEFAFLSEPFIVLFLFYLFPKQLI